MGGLMALAQGADMAPYWMSFVSVPDVDGSVEVAREIEGAVDRRFTGCCVLGDEGPER